MLFVTASKTSQVFVFYSGIETSSSPAEESVGVEESSLLTTQKPCSSLQSTPKLTTDTNNQTTFSEYLSTRRTSKLSSKLSQHSQEKQVTKL
jgi:hypothetical protein